MLISQPNQNCEDQARAIFKQFREDGDPEMLALWQWFMKSHSKNSKKSCVTS